MTGFEYEKLDVMGLAPLRTQAETQTNGEEFSTSVHSSRPVWIQHDEVVQHACARTPARAVSIVRNGGGSSTPYVVGAVSTALTAGFWLTLLHFTL